jgi:hypothetical protein
MFHVELRQFPHQGRAFNLDRDELDRRILEPWLRGEPVELQDRRFDPDKAKLTIYEGRVLELNEMGLGRGWANVTRVGEDVTDRLLIDARAQALAPPDLDELKRGLLARAASGPLSMSDVLQVAAELGAAGAERDAVWQLLGEGQLVLSRAGLA